MLQRAASNAYSWWWSSHIRTKQSKWLEQSLQDMEDKVQSMLTLIEEDGDSFAKRAEMYYKRRPELISYVEESYKTFRALADRYDILSKELQNANNTIATVCPEHVQFDIVEDEEGSTLKDTVDPQTPSSSPNVPKPPNNDLKRIIIKASKQHQAQKYLSRAARPEKIEPKSGLTKEEALAKINKLHKDILALQTIKEFVKSSYESGLEKYWGIENQIVDMQQQVCLLQDEFNMGTVIEDDAARTLMAEAAISSCQETLTMLQEKQEKSTREASEEYKKIEAACGRLQLLRKKYLQQQAEEGKLRLDDKTSNMTNASESPSKDLADMILEGNELEELPDKNNENFNLGTMANLTVSQLAEKIDQLVNKVISLETEVSSQTVLVNTLRTETDDLNAQIRILEDEKDNLVDDTQNLSNRVEEMEEKLNKIQDLNKNVESQNSNLQSNFAEARFDLDHLSEKLSSVKPDEAMEQRDSAHDGLFTSEEKLHEELKNEKDLQSVCEADKNLIAMREQSEDVKELDIDIQYPDPSLPEQGEVQKTIRKSSTFQNRELKEQCHLDHPRDFANGEAQVNTEKAEELDWQQMLLSGVEDREKILLKEYMTILRNYKDVKRKLSDMEKKERGNQFDITLKMREIKQVIQQRDEEIQCLHKRLNSLHGDNGAKEDNILPSRSSGDWAITPEARNEILAANEDASSPAVNKDIKMVFVDRTPSMSKVEQRLRMNIDAILDENLDFWLRFSTTFHQVQKFKTEVKDLQEEISKLREKKKPDGTISSQLKSEARPVYKHLREIQTELTVWLEQSVSLKDELKGRCDSLCDIQEQITRALREAVEEDQIKFSSHQAAKFQGEVLNMEQENDMVREELQAGVDHVRLLQVEIEKTLRKLNEEFDISIDQPENIARARVPLRSFLFGTKPKKQKHSIFPSVHPGRKYQILRASIRPARH